MLRRAALLVVVTLFAGCSRTTPFDDRYPHTADVLVVLERGRPFALRLTASQRYSPCVAIGDSARVAAPNAALSLATCRDTTTKARSATLATLAPAIAHALRDSATTDAIWAAALLDMASGDADARHLELAIRRLEEVRTRTNGDVRATTHLASALLMRAARTNDARDLLRAADRVERAYESDSTLKFIRYNRALLLTFLCATRQANVAWMTLRTSDPEWAGDVEFWRQRLTSSRAERRMPASIVDPQAAREFVLDTLIGNLASAYLNGDSARVATLRATGSSLASQLVSRGGDSSVAHIVRATSPEFLDRGVAEGLISLRDGNREYRLTRYASSDALLRRAKDRFVSSRQDALADWTELRRGAIEMNLRQSSRAAERLTGVAMRSERRHDVALASMAFWARGIAEGRRGDVERSIRSFTRARSAFAAIGELSNAAHVGTALGEMYGEMGRSLEAASVVYDGFTTSVAVSGEVRYEDLLSLGQQLVDDQLPFAAKLLVREATLAAERTARAKDLAESLGRLANAEFESGTAPEAKATLVAARGAAKLVEDSSMRSRVDAELNRTEALVLAHSAPRDAIRFIDAARLHFASLPVDDAPLLLQRSRIALSMGDSTVASRDLERATTITESLVRDARGDEGRAFQATLRDAQRTLVELSLARGDTSTALRATLKLAQDATFRASTRAADRVSLAEGEGELRYVIVPTKIISWLRVGSSTHAAVRETGANELRDLVVRFTNLLRSSGDEATVREVGKRLFALLIEPHAESLEGVRLLDIAPDGALNRLPFAMLVGRDDRFLVERVAIRYIVAAGSREGRVRRENSREYVPLIVGDPAWRASDFPGLAPLRWSGDEARSVASTYRHSTLLMGRDASKEGVERALGSHNMLHFAGHARVIADRPSTSHLVLTRESSSVSFSDGVLYADDIEHLSLGALRLVVLSSCGESGDVSASESPNGLALAFLDAGVGEVVSGFWEVDDEGAAGLMARFHREVAAGESAAEALRRAQVASLGMRGGWVGAGFGVQVGSGGWLGRNTR